MNHDDIKKMQEVASRLTREIIDDDNLDAKMEGLRQKEIEQDKMYLEELSDEEHEEVFMVLY